jgi:hypothetical protein
MKFECSQEGICILEAVKQVGVGQEDPDADSFSASYDRG